LTVGALGWSILDNPLLFDKQYPCYANFILVSQMVDDWTTIYCINEYGSPKVLYAATVRLGIPEHPEYAKREFMEHGTESCEVTVHIDASDKFLEMQPWSVTAIGARMSDTIQLVARKALRYLCQIFEWHLGSTPMKYFPMLDHNRPAWAARIRNLESNAGTKKDPTIVAMSGYLLSLDDLCDQLHQRVRDLIQRAERAESYWHRAKLALAQAEARATEAKSRFAAAEENLREQADHHSQLLRGVYLVDHAKRKERHPRTGAEPPILEGILLYSLSQPRRRIGESVPPTPSASPREAKDKDPEDSVVGTSSQVVSVDP
jgi:hypothetical protein